MQAAVTYALKEVALGLGPDCLLIGTCLDIGGLCDESCADSSTCEYL